MKKLSCALYASIVVFFFASCTSIDIYEKAVAIPGHEWKSDYKPSFQFEIQDTSVVYNIFLVIRHTEKYSFNNIYINLYVKGPGQDTAVRIQQDVLLGSNDKGWLGAGMDDVYEHRSTLATRQSLRAGTYTFTIEQIMREDPLKEVLNVGLRLEKEK